jgi:hypothetical protein
VLNGQLGAIWINIRDGFGDRIQQMYTTLYENAPLTKFNYDKAIEWFESHQGQWSEALYNFGSHQYYGGAPYSKWISSGLGDKKNQRRFWLYYGFRYRASKYHAGSSVNRITWRQFGTGSDLQMKTYSEMYVSLGFGAYDYKTTKRYRCLDLENGVTVKNEFTTNVNDVVMYLFNGDMITDIGNLYEFGNIGSLDLTNAKRLRWLRVGNKDKQAQYINTKLTALVLTSCDALEYLDLTSCQGFGTGTGQNGIYTLDLSKQTLLQEFYCKGATMSGITFPETPSLHTIHIGGGLSRLRLVNLSGLTDFQIESGDKITSVIMRNCGEVAKTQSYDILVNILSNENNVLSDVEIDGIDWQDASAEIVEMLCDKKAKLKGRINIIGANKVTFALKEKLKAQYGDIDNESNGLYIAYEKRDVRSVTMTPKQYFTEVGEYQLTFELDSPYANNYTHIEWSMASNLYATINPETGVVTVNRMGEEVDGTGPNADATITIYSPNGSSVSATTNLNFWVREVKLGDIVYHDGTVAPMDDHELNVEQGKIAIGVCFYISPYNKLHRLMIALKNVDTGHTWGVNTTDNPDLVLTDEIDLNVYNIKNIPNANASGNIDSLKGGQETDPDGWTIFNPNSNALGQIGFIELTEDLMEHKKGDMIPYGKYYTLSVIETRNRLLRDRSLNLPIPQATQNMTESTVLDNLLSSVSSSMGATAKSLYYPALSKAYSFQPTQNAELKDEFKAHNWFLPTMGELMRFAYHISKGVKAEDIGKAEAVLAPTISGGLLDAMGSYTYFKSSSEGSSSAQNGTMRYTPLVLVAANKNTNTQVLRYCCTF